VLGADLAPGQTANTLAVNAGSGTCTAKILTGKPDIVVSNAKWINDTTATVDVTNTNPFVTAGSSVVRFDAYKCSGSHPAIAGTKDSAAISLGKGEKKTVTVTLSKALFLTVTADVTKLVTESNESNNQQSTGSAGACIS